MRRLRPTTLPVYGLAGAAAFTFVLTDDLFQTFLWFVVAPLLALALLHALLFRSWSMAGAIAFLFAASAFLIALQRDDPYWMRSESRWLFRASSYKQLVLAQPLSPQELKHVEWDGWGGAAVGDTTMYLVFDPNDSLLQASRDGSSGAVSGVPAPVDRVHRLEPHWYTVLLPTDFQWQDRPKSQ